MRCAGAGAWVTPSSHTRQAYFGRTVTMTRSWAGTMSSRSVRSSPMRTISAQPQGQCVLWGSMTCSIRGRCLGRWPRLRCVSGRFARGVGAGLAGAVASASASAPSSASKASWSWSGWSFSDFLANIARRSSRSRCSRRRLCSVSEATRLRRPSTTASGARRSSTRLRSASAATSARSALMSAGDAGPTVSRRCSMTEFYHGINILIKKKGGQNSPPVTSRR